jgi:hypothetical protein
MKNLYSMASRSANSGRPSEFLADKMDENHFVTLIFTLQASRRIPSAALLGAKHSPL